MRDDTPLPPITEDDIAAYLANTPDFFERHALLLASVQLSHPLGQRTVSLQERQALLLRDKIKSLEHRIMDMIRHAHDNMVLTDKLHRWACELLATPKADLPTLAVDHICELFQVPDAALRLWALPDAQGASASADAQPATHLAPVSAAMREQANAWLTPHLGAGAGPEATQWLAAPAQAASVACLALRRAPGQTAFGLLVLASPDAQRFTPHMGTELLERLAQLAGAALSATLATPD